MDINKSSGREIMHSPDESGGAPAREKSPNALPSQPSTSKLKDSRVSKSEAGDELTHSPPASPAGSVPGNKFRPAPKGPSKQGSLTEVFERVRRANQQEAAEAKKVRKRPSEASSDDARNVRQKVEQKASSKLGFHRLSSPPSPTMKIGDFEISKNFCKRSPARLKRQLH